MVETHQPAVLLRARSASFGYAGRALLTGVDVELRAGELLAVVGPNGSGKTTLLRGLLGLIPPLTGAVECDRRRVGYVPQREALDPLYPLTTAELVEQGAFGRLGRFGHVRRRDRRGAVSALERVGLADRAASPFAALSGGQRQRALIARALLMDPLVLFMDEPTSGADPVAASSVLELVASLVRERGLAVVLVAHHLAALRTYTDRALFVHCGRVERGALSELDDPNRALHIFRGEGAHTH